MLRYQNMFNLMYMDMKNLFNTFKTQKKNKKIALK